MSLVKQALVAELTELAMNAKDFKEKIDTAKTFLKRDIYKKKLKENNKRAADVLGAIAKLAQSQAVGGVVDEAPSATGRVETPSAGTASLE